MKPMVRALCVLLVLMPASGFAQETRADEIAQAQAEKARQAAPYVPSKAERIATELQARLFASPDGFYPWFDSVYSGGGLTLGGGYRKYYADNTSWTTRGLYSAKNYKLIEVATDSVGLANGKLDAHAFGGWRDAPQVAYYGTGGDTSQDAISNFHFTQAYVGTTVRAKGPARTIADFGLQYESFTTDSGAGSSPSIEQIYTPTTAAGLDADPDFLHMTVTGGVDTRPAAGYARRGGLYALSYENYIDVGNTYTFDRLQAELVQHVPILRDTWVLSFHGVVRTTLDDSDTVPYFLLPSLGSGSTLRAYPSWRFRDRHSLLMSGEWRWIPNRMFLDVAIFYDAGKVASRREDLTLTGLKHDWGLGVRFHGPLATPLRVDIARGSEGFNLVFAGSAAF
jgi:hypothetical protein